MDAAKALLTASGFSPDDVDVALEAITVAKEQSPAKEDEKYKFFLDRTIIYEDRDAFIFKRKRGDKKSAIWYFRIYDYKRNKPLVKSLKTRDKTQALASARVLYIEIKGKIERGERLKQITTPELVELWLKKLEKQITNIPHEGITPDTFKLKKGFSKNWLLYIEHLGLSNKSIDKLKPEIGRDFGTWLKAKPKQTSLRTGSRSHEQINNNISFVIRMYHRFAIREKYISADLLPQFDRVKYEISEAYKRDILSLPQYDKYVTYLKRKYITKKHNPDLCISKKGIKELEIRKIFSEFILILSNGGFRTKELLGMKFKEIYASPSFTDEEKKDNVVMVVRRENAKTGRRRSVVAPVKKRIDRIIAAYKKLGITHEPEDFLFINPLSPTRNNYGRMIMYQRLKKTLVDSGVQAELDKENKSVSPYSFRHFYAYYRLLNRVPIYLLAKNMGTSVQKIESTYGHINTELHSEVLTAGQGIFKRTGTSLQTLPTLDD